MITAQQLQKYTQVLFNQLYPTDSYDSLKGLLYSWRDHNKTPSHAIATFLRITRLLQEHHPELIEDLNRCLVKDFASPPTTSLPRVRTLALHHPQSLPILDSLIQWIRTDSPLPPPTARLSHLEELTESEFASRLERHEKCKEISKVIYLYRRCMVTVEEFKALLSPIYLSDPSFFNMLFQFAEEVEGRRRRVTIFAPLNELVDQKYPLEQVGNSYITIPEGYANWGRSWCRNLQEKWLNRVCVSVPLGTEGSFVITRKNEFEQQLLKNEQEKYEIDSNLATLQAAIRLIEKTRRLSHPLVLRILGNIYPADVIGMMRNAPAEVATGVVVPRLRQKLGELGRCRAKFEKFCEEVAAKNFYKSLDYRCFYFCKNDKKFNCPQRWEKEIELRKKEVALEQATHASGLLIEDRESLQHSRNYALNSFDNITNQQLLPEFRLEFGDRRPAAPYPPFPQNQVLFLLDFSDLGLLNQVLQILLYHTQKKSLLQLIVFKLMRMSIEKRLNKQAAALQYIEGRAVDDTSSEPLNDHKTAKRPYKELTDELLDLLEEPIDPAEIEHFDFPFEGPEDHTFICTKQIYFFVRYLLTIYHRFSRAKTLSEDRTRQEEQRASDCQRGEKGVEGEEGRGGKDGAEGRGGEEPSVYGQFLSVLIHKLKEQKGLEQYLRRIFQQDAFIFFTLDKLILGAVKLINNISADSLTYKVLKDGVKDFELEIRSWSNYVHPSVSEQLTRLSREPEPLFRFTFAPHQKHLFISAWENRFPLEPDRKKQDEALEKSIDGFMNEPVYYTREPQSSVSRACSSEYAQDESGVLVMWGEEGLVRKRPPSFSLTGMEREINRVRKLRLL